VSLRIAVALVFAVFLISGAVSGQETAAESIVDIGIEGDGLPRELNGFDGEIRGLWRDGRVLIGGQPDESAFDRFQEMGVTVVVSLRSTAEMDDRERIPFDEAALVESLGMEYVHIPLGGDDHPYTPQAVDRLSDVLERHDGPVLIHCTVAWRASHMWAAYLVREQGFSLEDAMARGEAMAIGDLPVEGLLGRQVQLAYAD
jgi:uncharacterized protein (TIGR01244 family)